MRAPAYTKNGEKCRSYTTAFDEQKHLLLDMVTSWSQDELVAGFEHLLQHIDSSRFNAIFNILEKRRQHDVVSQMPYEISVYIFSFLDYHSLQAARSVNRRWRYISSDERLWKIHWQRMGWRETEEESDLVDAGKITQLDLFMDRLQLERNWLQGDYFLHTLLGHADGITSLHYSGNRLVTGSHDRSVKVWNIKTGQTICTIPHASDVTCVKLFGNTLISATWDGLVKVWHVNGAQADCTFTFRDHTAAVLSLAFNGGRCCVTGSFDNTVRLYDVRQGKLLRTLRGHSNSVLAVQFDSRIVVSGSEDTTIRIWSSSDGQLMHSLEGHEAAVTCLHIDDNHIVSGSCDRTIRVWSRADGNLLRTLFGHQAAIHAIQFGQGKIVSGAGNDSIKIWDFRTGQCLHTLEEHKAHVTCLQFDHHKIISGAGDACIKIINFGDPFKEHSRLAEGLPVVRKRRAKSLSGSYSISVLNVA